MDDTLFNADSPLNFCNKDSKICSRFICVYNLASLARSMIADPRIAVTETDWDNLLKATDNPIGCRFLLSARVAIRLRVLRTVSENPPNVSKAKGMNWIPTSLQFWAYCSYFLSSVAERAKPLFSDAFIMGLDCKGEVTVTSEAAGRPLFQTGKKISPGLELLSGSKLFCSEMGDKRAPEQADIILSRIRSWREIISARPWHDTAWSPITSRVPDLQKGHFLSFSYNFTPSRYLRATRNSLEDRCSPRAGMGAADNQAPDCGRERDCKRAFSLKELCFPNKLSKAELSSSSWIFLWEGYVVAILLNSSTALTNEMSSVGLWPVNFSTRTEDWKTDPTYAAWTWSADRLIPTPVLLIGRHAWSQEVSDNKTPRIPSKVARWTESNFRRILFDSSEGELHRKE